MKKYRDDHSSLSISDAVKLAAIDYQFNKKRCGLDSDGFIPPRWVPDVEVTQCQICQIPFDSLRRKHHCRHCGNIFCGSCSSSKCLLPKAFNIQEPQRVCSHCRNELIPHQEDLINMISHQNELIALDLSTNRRFFNMPFSLSMEQEIQKAAYTAWNTFSVKYIKDSSIAFNLLQSAMGIVFLTVIKGGFMFAPRLGSGLIVARLSDGRWSAPCAIATVGLSWGFLAGVGVTDYMILLRTPEAVEAFCGDSQLTLGGELEVALGPVGRTGGADLRAGAGGITAPVVSYSHSKGLYAGVSLDGAVIVTRPDVNSNFYGRPHSTNELLRGDVNPPVAAAHLYAVVQDVLRGDDVTKNAYSRTSSCSSRVESENFCADGDEGGEGEMQIIF